jgi:diguanylate cyclase (GGDEF)-like protein
MIYALLTANVSASLIGLVVAQHLSGPLAVNPLGLTPELFAQSPRLFLVGTLTLFADTILIILVYEAVSRILRPLLLRIWASLAIVLVFDTLIFVTGGFVEHPAYVEILLSGILGKVGAAVVYAVALTLYLPRAGTREDSHPGLGDLFQVLTYRQKFEALRAQAARDPLTGVYNRGFCDEILNSQIAAARRSGAAVAVMMVDVDHFKRINDSLGHAAGDRALQVIAQALGGAVRTSDIVCRYGGEEFCLILPGTPLDSATLLAGRICEAVPEACAHQGVGGGERVSVTIGLAACPDDGTQASALVGAADRRLYQGKKEGRDRFVAA